MKLRLDFVSNSSSCSSIIRMSAAEKRLFGEARQKAMEKQKYRYKCMTCGTEETSSDEVKCCCACGSDDISRFDLAIDIVEKKPKAKRAPKKRASSERPTCADPDIDGILDRMTAAACKTSPSYLPPRTPIATSPAPSIVSSISAAAKKTVSKWRVFCDTWIKPLARLAGPLLIGSGVFYLLSKFFL